MPATLPFREPRTTVPGPSIPDAAEARRAWLFLGLGLLALPLQSLPFVRGATGILSAIAHELGHTAAGWLSGCASIPRLAPGHYADTLIGQQSPILAFALCAVVARITWFAWRPERSTSVKVVVTTLAVVYPLVIFTGLREVVFLWAGHGFEVVFAGICFWRAYTGGYTESTAERGAYSVCGWALLSMNLTLFLGLIYSLETRAVYLAGSPSGWPNDLVRVASAWGMSLGTVAALAAAGTIATSVGAVVLARRALRVS